MKISVIIPVYNSEQYLEKCLLSIMNQTYSDLEILCINDGSTDRSGEILSVLAQQDSRLQVITQENSGVSVARNRGLELATGEWVSFIDSDDELEQDMYETLTSLALQYDADIAHCGYRRMCLDGTHKDVMGTGNLLIQTSAEASECLIKGIYFSGGLWNKIFQRTLLSALRFDPTLTINEDVLFNVQAFKRAQTIVFWDIPKYHYFERTQSTCICTNEIIQRQNIIRAADKMLSIYEGDTLEGACIDRLLNNLIGLYRCYVLHLNEFSNWKSECELLHRQIRNREYKGQSKRSKLNYRFMRCLPHLYRFIYRIYNHIRTPNWDVRSR